MKTFNAYLTKHLEVETTITADSLEEAVEIAESRYDGFKVRSVNDVDVLGRCEDCRAVIRENDNYAYDSESGFYFCNSCRGAAYGQ